MVNGRTWPDIASEMNCEQGMFGKGKPSWAGETLVSAERQYMLAISEVLAGTTR